MTAAGLYKKIYYLTMPKIYYLTMPSHKVHGHVPNENGAIACIIYSVDAGFDKGFLMNCAGFRSCVVTKSTLMILDFVS